MERNRQVVAVEQHEFDPGAELDDADAPAGEKGVQAGRW